MSAIVLFGGSGWGEGRLGAFELLIRSTVVLNDHGVITEMGSRYVTPNAIVVLAKK